MAFHHENTHARLHDARHLLQMEKRGSLSHVKLSLPDNKMDFIHRRPVPVPERDNAVETVVSEVYVTMSQTFNGPVASYVTESGTPAAALSSATSSADAQSAYAAAKSSAQAGRQSSSLQTTPPQLTRSSTSLQTTPPQFTRSSSSLQTTPPQFTRSSAVASSATLAGAGLAGTPLSATRTASPNVIADKSSGMSGGAKAGLAIGVILLIAAAAGLVFFCWRRRKNADRDGQEQLYDEKRSSFFGGRAASLDFRRSAASDKVPASIRSTRTASTAPRLSLRPVTQFLPNIMGGERAANNAPAMSEKPKSGWERRAQNPFDDAAVLSEKQARPESPPTNPFDEGDGSHGQSPSWEGNEPLTPKSTKFGTAAAVPVTAAGAARQQQQQAAGPNNVHRVQLDFKPSMDDELELRSGQLVRMLHEYDDGWALCIRMDRSQQGVCPRTCLSKLPVKPRPQGPPPPQNGRPQMGPGSAGPRPFSPQNGMIPRPLTPTSQSRERSATAGARTESPAPESRNRSQTAGGADRPMSPNGMPARKPVPGMAL